MRERHRLAFLVAAGALVAACGSGSDAAGDPVSSSPVVTVDGIGQLPDTVPPALGTRPPSVGTPTTVDTPDPRATESTVDALDQRPAEEYVIDQGNGRRVDDPRILLIGDSVLEATTFFDPDALDRYVATLGWRIWVDAQRGRHMDQGVDRLEELLAGEPPWDTGWVWPSAADGRGPVVPQTVVVMLGNNYEGVRDELEEAVDELLTLLDGAERIVLFTVPVYKPEQADVNATVRRAARRDGRVVLVDWERFASEWQGVLQGDALHPSDLGGSLLAQLIARAVGPAPDPPALVDLPVLGVLTEDLLPVWTPPKARETVPLVP